MIKFNTQLGFKHLNMKARIEKEMMQPLLKGLHCRKCTGVNTMISFEEMTYTGYLPNVKVPSLIHVIDACCDEFKERIITKLKSR